MVKPIIKRLHDVALYAPDPDKLAEFYENVLGLRTINRSRLSIEGIRSSVYLSCASEGTAYQLSIFANPDIKHIAFELPSLTVLKVVYEQIIQRELRIKWILNHGISLALYFYDPADNLVKLFWSTGIDYPQPYSCPINIDQPESEILQTIDRLKKKLAEEDVSQ